MQKTISCCTCVLRMFPEFSLKVLRMLPEFSLNVKVPWTFPECSVNVPRIIRERSLNAAVLSRPEYSHTRREFLPACTAKPHKTHSLEQCSLSRFAEQTYLFPTRWSINGSALRNDGSALSNDGSALSNDGSAMSNVGSALSNDLNPACGLWTDVL
jgi:hypothetical protein